MLLLLTFYTERFLGLRGKVSTGLLSFRMDVNNMLCLYKLTGILITVSLRADMCVAVGILNMSSFQPTEFVGYMLNEVCRYLLRAWNNSPQS